MLAARVLALPMLAALSFSMPVDAEDFRIQTQLSYDQVSPDAAGAPDVDVFALSGTYFLSPVPTDGVPVGEAAYIARSSYADVVASYADNGDDHADALAADFGYHVPDTIFFGRVGVVSTDLPGGDDTSWNGTFGIVPIPRLFFGTDFSEGGYDPNVTARYAGKLANDHWYAASVNVIDVDEGDTDVGFQVDYYFPSFKLGGGYNTAGDSWTVRAEAGLPHGFALLGRYFAADDGDGFGLTLTWRDL